MFATSAHGNYELEPESARGCPPRLKSLMTSLGSDISLLSAQQPLNHGAHMQTADDPAVYRRVPLADDLHLRTSSRVPGQHFQFWQHHRRSTSYGDCRFCPAYVVIVADLALIAETEN